MEDTKKHEGVAPRKGPRTITLVEPIQWGSEVIRELVIKPPRAKHVKNINPKELKIGDMLSIAAKLAGVSASALDELCMEDVGQVTEAVGELL